MNNISAVGRIGKDAELRHLQNGGKVATFTLAVEKQKKPNEEKPGTDWFRVDVWGNLAEKLAPYLKKGTQVFVIGRFELEMFTKQDGTQGHSLNINANNIQLLARPQAQQQSAPQQPVAARLVVTPPATPPTSSDWDAVFGGDEISF